MFSMKLCILFLALLLGNVVANGYYQVIGSKTVRPQSDFHVSVSIDGTEVPTLVTTILEGKSYNGSLVSIEDDTEILPYSSQILSLKVPFIPPGAYRLHVQGRGGINFQSFYPLEYLRKSFSVLIETDKSTYNPGSTVQYRVIVLDSHLKPVGNLPSGGLTIIASDSKGNKIRLWKSVKTSSGVYSNEFQLSPNPVLGAWNITVQIEGQEYFKTIQVARYIIPDFRIDVETKEHVTFQDKKIIANIRTYYHQGGKLEGEATISAFPTIFSQVIQPIFQNPFRRVVPIDGTALVEFDIEKDLKLSDEYERTIILDVAVEERQTGRRENTTMKVHIHKYDYKIDLIKTSDYYKPGLKYTLYVKVSRHDGKALTTNEEITIRHGFSEKEETPIERKHVLDKYGVAKLDFLTPANVTNVTALRIEAQFRDLKEIISPVVPAVSYSNTFLQTILMTDKPLVNLDIEILVTSTEPMKYINYVVFGRGDVLLSKTLQVNNKKEFEFRFMALHAMIPLAHLVVFYIRDNGEMIGDTLDIHIDGLARNYLEIRSSTTETEPNFDIDIQMKTQPHSFVGLMAVDQRSYALDSSYHLSESVISNDLLGYDSAEKSNYLSITRNGKTRFPWKPGGSNIYSGIQNSGGDVVTNAHIQRKIPTLDDIYLRPIIYDRSTVKPDKGFGLHLPSATRPPLAGPYAFSRIPVPVWNTPKVYLKESLADTWIFSNFSTRYDGVISTRKRLPNSLTNWIMTGFSLDPVYGIGIMSPKLYRTSRQFFIKMDLPYSIHRGESINIPIHIYNRMDRNVDVEVTMHNPNRNFEFTSVTNEVTDSKNSLTFQRKRSTVNGNSNGTVWFMITPLKLGLIQIKATASNPNTQDSISEYLHVEAEGETEYYTKAEVIDLRNVEYVKKNMNFTIPKNIIKDSEKIQVTVVGNIFGPTLRNLDSVIRKPTGCGEQNLLFMMTSLIVLKYLQSLKQPMPLVRERASMLLEGAYQTQLSFKRDDGSFSVFGMRDKEGSVWLTAYALMAFRKASEFIYIDEKIIENGYDWLIKHQGRNGSFYEIGNEIYNDMQKKTGNSLPLTAYSLISLFENQKYSTKYKNSINKGLDYIARYIDESEETYSIALCSFVLQKYKHPSRQSAFNLLDSRARYKDGMKWWSKPMVDEKNPWNNLPKSVDLEMTSYALLTFLENNLLEDAMPIINWILKQHNSIGGFSSSQDTVMGLQALFELMKKLSTPTNAQIDFTYNEKDVGNLKISQNDLLTEQTFELDKNSREVNVTAKGSGIAFFKINYQYNTDVTGPWPMFILDPQIDKNSNRDHIQLSICIRFVKERDNTTDSEVSNMAVMEVNLPSGYVADMHSLSSLEVSQHVEYVEVKKQLTQVILYFNNVSSSLEYCPTVSAFRIHKIANQKPVAVVLFDYYDTSRRARVFYRPPTTTVCDICTDIDCESACVIAPNPQVREGKLAEKNSSAFVNSSIIIVLLSVLVQLTGNPISF